MREYILPMQEQYEEYLIDESKFTGKGESISFPESEEEIKEILKELKESGTELTIQGGKTGITGAAVPEGGHILNLSHMNHVKGGDVSEDGNAFIIVEPGINLMDLKKEIDSMFRKNPVFWPPDPTETSATVGGVAATNAQGICRLLYGTSKKYIESIKVMDLDGNIREISWGKEMILPSGKAIEEMDTVLGKEGITGIITELKLKLIPKPESVWGISFFFVQPEDAGNFIDYLKKEQPSSDKAAIAAVEYMDRTTIDLIEERKETMTKIKELPDIEEEIQSMVYIELQGAEEGIEEIAEILMEVAMEYHSDPETAWAVSGESDVEKMHAFRHAAAETANLFIEKIRRGDQRITKLGTDMAVLDRPFSEVLKNAQKELKENGLSGCIFGHAMENHLHINILPNNFEEYEKGIQLLKTWAEEVSSQQGKVVGEHGIGKLKKRILGENVPSEYLALCKDLKGLFDKENRLNKGNIF